MKRTRASLVVDSALAAKQATPRWDYEVEMLADEGFELLVQRLQDHRLGPARTIRALRLLGHQTRQMCFQRKPECFALTLRFTAADDANVRDEAVRLVIAQVDRLLALRFPAESFDRATPRRRSGAPWKKDCPPSSRRPPRHSCKERPQAAKAEPTTQLVSAPRPPP
jgi:hypothetical protein